MTRLLVLTALDAEARALARHLGLAPVPGATSAHFGGGGLELAAVGLRGARLGARAAQWRVPDVVVSAGVCGALAPALGVGELVVPTTVIAAGERWATAALPGLPAHGALLTVTDVLESAADKARLWMETGALAVDMESAAVMAWAQARGVAAAVVRAVSDDASRGIPAALAGAVGEDGRIRPLRAVTAALARATSVNELLDLRAGTGAALKTVAAALARLARA